MKNTNGNTLMVDLVQKQTTLSSRLNCNNARFARSLLRRNVRKKIVIKIRHNNRHEGGFHMLPLVCFQQDSWTQKLFSPGFVLWGCSWAASSALYSMHAPWMRLWLYRSELWVIKISNHNAERKKLNKTLILVKGQLFSPKHFFFINDLS